MRIDTSKSFVPLKIVVITISDSRTEKNDKSGQFLTNAVQTAGHELFAKKIISDDIEKIVAMLRTYILEPAVEVIICTGGTGLTTRDVTPEAFQQVIEKEIPGFGELFRYLSFQKIGTSTIQSRATAGTANQTLLFALPGSTGACKDAWEGILKWQLDIRHRPCNFAEILPRMGKNARGKSL